MSNVHALLVATTSAAIDQASTQNIPPPAPIVSESPAPRIGTLATAQETSRRNLQLARSTAASPRGRRDEEHPGDGHADDEELDPVGAGRLSGRELES